LRLSPFQYNTTTLRAYQQHSGPVEFSLYSDHWKVTVLWKLDKVHTFTGTEHNAEIVSEMDAQKLF
jgi:hypothetical protein